MHTLNHEMDECFLNADGAYLDSRGLQVLEQYAESYAARLEAYNALREHSTDMVNAALDKMAQQNPEVIQKHRPRCLYDMTQVLRYIALSILRNDEIFFKEMMMSWLDTVLLAYKRNEHCATSYRFLQEIIDARMPASSSMVRPYLDVVILALQSHA